MPRDDYNVSCQVLGQIFVICDEKGIPTEQVLDGVPFTRDYINTPSNFIDWSSLVRIFNNVAADFLEDEILDMSSATYDQPIFVVYRLIGRLRFDLRGFYLYLFGNDSIVARFYPVNSEVVRDDSAMRHLVFRFELPDDLEPCKMFFMVLEGQARGISKAMGYGEAHVVANYFDRGMEMSVDLPVESGWFNRTRNWLLRPIEMLKAGLLLYETQNSLLERNRELIKETEQLRRAQIELAQQQEQLNLLASTTPILLWTVNMNFQTLYCSPSVERLLGYTQEEAMRFAPLSMVDETSQRIVVKVFTQQMALEEDGAIASKSEPLRLRHVRKDGSTFWSENYLAFTRDIDGKPSGIVGVSINIDDEVRREEREAFLEDQLNQAEREDLISKVAGGIAHDFNNALQSIIGYSEVMQVKLEQGAEDFQSVKRYPELIQHAASSSAELVKQLLAFSRQQTLNIATLEVGQWLSGIEPVLVSLVGENVRFSMNIEENLHVMADSNQLERVVVNLVLNARDAMGSIGELTIRGASCLPDDVPDVFSRSGEHYLCLSVEDSGTGIAERLLDRIFDPYFTTKPSEVGSGLGLAVSAGIIEQHNGLIRALNTERGTRMEVFLPLTEAPDAEPTRLVPEGVELSGRTVLVADDQTMIVDLVKAVLESNGMHVLTSVDGSEAVSIYQQQGDDIDLVLLDMVMPGLNGDEVARQIRQLNPGAAIIIMTGYVGNPTILESLQSETLLPKPFTRKALMDVLLPALQTSTHAD